MSIPIYQPQINKAIDKKNTRLWGWRHECITFLYGIRVLSWICAKWNESIWLIPAKANIYFCIWEQCDSETHKCFFLPLQALFIMLKAHYHFNFYFTILINCYQKKGLRFELCVVLESLHEHQDQFFPQCMGKYSMAQLISIQDYTEPQDKGDKTTSSLSSCSLGFLHLPLKTQLEMDPKIHHKIIRSVS